MPGQGEGGDGRCTCTGGGGGAVAGGHSGGHQRVIPDPLPPPPSRRPGHCLTARRTCSLSPSLLQAMGRLRKTLVFVECFKDTRNLNHTRIGRFRRTYCMKEIESNGFRRHMNSH